MSLNSLVYRIISLEKFKKEYSNLLVSSVRSQIPNLDYENIAETNPIDWSYLLTCASLFSKSSEGPILDMAYRICQATLCAPNSDKIHKNTAAVLFNLSSNNSAVQLSKKRKLIDDNYQDYIPFGTLIDCKRKQFSNSIITNDSVYTLNEFQKQIYSSFEECQSITVSAPTSAGKSFVLLHLLSNFIETHTLARVAYIVPTRALIQQVELDVRQHLKNANVEITSVPVLPETYDTHPSVFILTQERLQWILNEHPNIKFNLIIVDEAHKIGDRARGILLQQVLQEISYAGSAKFIFASPMSENPGALFGIIKPEGKQLAIVSEIVTVNQNLIWVSKAENTTTKWNIDLLAQGKRINLGSLTSERITKSSMRLPILAYRIAAGNKGNLLYVNGAADAEKIAIQLKSMVLNDYPEYQPSDRIIELIKLIKKTVHSDYALIEVLKGGVAFHYGNMPLAIRNEIEELFKIGDISFLVCTSTLIEGVNLPAKSIFVRGPQKGKNKPMDEMDFWNLAGRAGRQGKEFQGNIFCLDAGDENVWKAGTPEVRKKYKIKSTVDSIVESQSGEFLEYITSKKAITNKSEMDYAYTYFLSLYYQYGGISQSFIKDMYGASFCESIDAAFNESLVDIKIPSDIVAKNQGVNPVAQQKLLSYFVNFDRDVQELIPPYPEEDNAQERYMHIIGRISSNLTGDPPKLNMYRSVLITNWLRGYGLARIISDNIKWHKKNHTGKSTAAIIRDTMRDIEEYARFRFLKYTTCYIDILKYYLALKNHNELLEKIPQLNLWLEFGASKTTQISLMSMGFTRTAALEFSDLMVDENFNKKQCIQWFHSNNIHAMDLPAAIIAEADYLMDLQ